MVDISGKCRYCGGTGELAVVGLDDTVQCSMCRIESVRQAVATGKLETTDAILMVADKLIDVLERIENRGQEVEIRSSPAIRKTAPEDS